MRRLLSEGAAWHRGEVRGNERRGGVVTQLRIEGLTKRFAGKPPTVAMDDLSLDIEEGEFLVLLGPSGCGKTTTLRCLAGLETPDEGRIAFGERDVFDSSVRLNLSPDKRNIGMVFQSYALWPHMTVRKNIGYPLKARKLKGPGTRSWVEETAALVDCSELLDRYPSQLSGGQQQRVALARGLVARPDVVLFDEPLSNLDARLRDQVRAQLHELHARLRFSAVFVTHDQSEALALADRVAIMRAGRFEQIGTPEHVFEEPATEYVAGFIGMSNRVPLVRRDGAWTFHSTDVTGELPLPGDPQTATVRLRPEDLQLAPPSAESGPGPVSFRAQVVDAQFGGRHMDVVVKVKDTRLHARVPTAAFGGWARRVQMDQEVVASFAPSGAVYYGDDDTRIAGHVDVDSLSAAGVTS
jgi:iron(III) transport system ATP-binding protein